MQAPQELNSLFMPTISLQTPEKKKKQNQPLKYITFQNPQSPKCFCADLLQACRVLTVICTKSGKTEYIHLLQIALVTYKAVHKETRKIKCMKALVCSKTDEYLGV